MNYDHHEDVASGYVMKASRFHYAFDILSEINTLLEAHGCGFEDNITYNPNDDPIFQITIKVEKQ